MMINQNHPPSPCCLSPSSPLSTHLERPPHTARGQRRLDALAHGGVGGDIGSIRARAHGLHLDLGLVKVDGPLRKRRHRARDGAGLKVLGVGEGAGAAAGEGALGFAKRAEERRAEHHLPRPGGRDALVQAAHALPGQRFADAVENAG